MVASFSIPTSFTVKFDLVFVLTQKNVLSSRFHFKVNRKSIGSSKKRYQGFTRKIALRLSDQHVFFFVAITRDFDRSRDRHVFMWQWLEILNVFNILTLKQIFWKAQALFKKLVVLRLTTQHFYTKLLCQKPMLRQMEWREQNWPVTKTGLLPVTVFFFRTFCFNLRTSPKELSWCTNYLNVYINTF